MTSAQRVLVFSILLLGPLKTTAQDLCSNEYEKIDIPKFIRIATDNSSWNAKDRDIALDLGCIKVKAFTDCLKKKETKMHSKICETWRTSLPKKVIDDCTNCRKPQGGCYDAVPLCPLFAKYGSCKDVYMRDKECRKTCGTCKDSGTKLRDPVCGLPKVDGLCYAAMRRFFFNYKTGVCESFIYGGCGGNGNRFKYKKECELKCSDTIQFGEESLPRNEYFKRAQSTAAGFRFSDAVLTTATILMMLQRYF